MELVDSLEEAKGRPTAVDEWVLDDLGLHVLYDSVSKLAKLDHPPIGLAEIGDTQIWLGWLMLAALFSTGFPPVVLGRIKSKLAERRGHVFLGEALVVPADERDLVTRPGSGATAGPCPAAGADAGPARVACANDQGRKDRAGP